MGIGYILSMGMRATSRFVKGAILFQSKFKYRTLISKNFGGKHFGGNTSAEKISAGFSEFRRINIRRNCQFQRKKFGEEFRRNFFRARNFSFDYFWIPSIL